MNLLHKQSCWILADHKRVFSYDLRLLLLRILVRFNFVRQNLFEDKPMFCEGAV